MPPTQKQMDDYMQRVYDTIERAGWMVQGVLGGEGDEPPFAYTVGCSLSREADSDTADPELILFGLHPEIAMHILNDAVRQHRNGQRVLVAGGRYDDVIDKPRPDLTLPVVFVEVPAEKVSEYLTVANRVAQERGGVEQVTALQMVWPDSDGVLPWEPAFDHKYDRMQPVLGTPPTV